MREEERGGGRYVAGCGGWLAVAVAGWGVVGSGVAGWRGMEVGGIAR